MKGLKYVCYHFLYRHLWWSDRFPVSQPAREGPALRALGLLLADGALTVGRGKTFWHVNRFFFTKAAVTRERKVKKSLPRWVMNGLCEGYKRAVDQNWGRMAKIGFFGPKPRFWAQKTPLLDSNGPQPEKVVQRKTLPFPKWISVS